MTYRILLPIGFALVPLGMLLMLWMFGPTLAGGPDFIPAPAGDVDPVAQLGLLTAGVDQTVTMLTSILIGLFVLVGVSLQRALDREHRGNIVEAAAGCIFIANAVLALYFGYAARMQALEFAGYAYPSFEAIAETIGRMAMFVGIACASSFFLASSLFLVERPAPPLAAAAGDVDPAAAKPARARRRPSGQAVGS